MYFWCFSRSADVSEEASEKWRLGNLGGWSWKAVRRFLVLVVVFWRRGNLFFNILYLVRGKCLILLHKEVGLEDFWKGEVKMSDMEPAFDLGAALQPWLLEFLPSPLLTLAKC